MSTTSAISAARVSALLKRNGITTLPSGISASYQGVRVRNGLKINSRVQQVDVSVDLPRRSERTAVVAEPSRSSRALATRCAPTLTTATCSPSAARPDRLLRLDPAQGGQ